MTPTSQDKEQEPLRGSDLQKLGHKIARQMVAFQYPQGKRTNGEMNEDAYFIEANQYHKNIMSLITAHTALAEVYSRLSELNEAYGKGALLDGYYQVRRATLESQATLLREHKGKEE